MQNFHQGNRSTVWQKNSSNIVQKCFVKKRQKQLGPQGRHSGDFPSNKEAIKQTRRSLANKFSRKNRWNRTSRVVKQDASGLRNYVECGDGGY